MNKTFRGLLGLGLTAALVTSPLVATGALADENGEASGSSTAPESSSSRSTQSSPDTAVVPSTAAPAASDPDVAAEADSTQPTSPAPVGNVTTPDMTPSAADAEDGQAPSAPSWRVSQYNESSGSASIILGWSAPADADENPFDFYYLDAYVDGAPFVSTKINPAAETTTLSVPPSIDQTWQVRLSAANTFGESAGVWVTVDTPQSAGHEPSTELPSDPIRSNGIRITSVASLGDLVDPGFALSWSFDAREVEKYGDELTGFVIRVTGPAAVPGGLYSIQAVGPDARSAAVRGGGSYGDESGAFAKLPSRMGMTISIVAVIDGAEEQQLKVVTDTVYPNPIIPATPAEPTGSTGGATATVANGLLWVTLPNLEPGTSVFGFVFSTPVPLNWTAVGPNRDAAWSLAGIDLAPGVHHVSVVDQFENVVATAAFTIPAVADPNLAATATSGPRTLASTGSDADLPLGVAAALLLAGAALITVRRVRAVRATHTEA